MRSSSPMVALLGLIMPMFIGIQALWALENTPESSPPEPAPTRAAEQQPIERIVVLSLMENCCSDVAWVAAEKRILLELNLLNLRVVKVPGDEAASNGVWGRDDQVELTRLAYEHRAVSAVRFSLNNESGLGEAALCLRDPQTRKITFRRLFINQQETTEPATVAALRSVEAIRVNIKELKLPEVPPIEKKPPPKKVSPPTPPALKTETVEPKPPKAPSFLTLAAGIAGFDSPGQVDPLGGVTAALGWRPNRVLAIELDGAISVIGSDNAIEQENSHASFYLAPIRVKVAAAFLRSRWFQMSAGLAGGAVIFWGKGHSETNEELTPPTQATGYVGATTQLGFALTQYLWLKLGFDLGFLLPTISVEFDAEQFTTYGIPLMQGYLVTEFHFEL